MSAIYLLIPLALVIAAGAVWAFVWFVRTGQMDDLDTPPVRMLLDDTDRPGRTDASDDSAGEPSTKSDDSP